MIFVHDFINQDLLVSREISHTLTDALTKEINEPTIVIDFMGIAGISPGFFSELLIIYTSLLNIHRPKNEWLILMNIPTVLSEKFLAVVRCFDDLVIREQDSNRWLIKRRVSDEQC